MYILYMYVLTYHILQVKVGSNLHQLYIIVRHRVKVTTGCSNAEGPRVVASQAQRGRYSGARGVTTASSYLDSASNLFRVSAHVA